MFGVVLLSAPRPAGPGDAYPPATPIQLPPGAEAYDTAAQAARDGSGDVVLLREGTLLPDGWARLLTDAAKADDRVATVSALASRGTAGELAERSGRVREAALGLRPCLAAPVGPCILLRREAIELVGWPRACEGSAAHGLRDFAAACTAGGLLHVVADDLLVLAGQAPEAEDTSVDPLLAASDTGPLQRVREVARRAVEGLSVTIDARLLDGPLGGSQVHALALISALAATGGARLRVLLGPDPSPDSQAALRDLDLETLTYAEAADGPAPHRSDVVHRPMQVYTVADIALLRIVGHRIVVTHHDNILYHDPAYFPDRALWRSYRRVTGQALAEADRVVFSTIHARDDALREDLVTPERSVVLALGTDHEASGRTVAPPTLDACDARPFLLCLGSDLLHKNRPFSIRLMRSLHELGWDGRLVLAGARAPHGSSAQAERDLIAGWPDAAGRVITLDHVSEPEREWLMAHCAGVAFTSVSEGFGLPPFEAARRGVPCLFAHRTAMAELLPESAATLVPWDAAASARNALPVLEDPAVRARHLELMRAAAEPLTWARFARELLEVYDATARSPARAVSALAAQADEREREMLAFYDLARSLQAQLDALGPDALGLVGRDGILPADVQRALLAAAGRERVRPPLFALLRAGYRVAHRRGR